MRLMFGSFVASEMYFRRDASAIKSKLSSAGFPSGQDSGNETEGIFDCVGVGVGLKIATPLFQTNFSPDLMHVKTLLRFVTFCL